MVLCKCATLALVQCFELKLSGTFVTSQQRLAWPLSASQWFACRHSLSRTFLNISQFRKMTLNSPLVSPPPPPPTTSHQAMPNCLRAFLLSPVLAWSPYKVSNFADKWFLDGCKDYFVFNSEGPIADWSRSKQRIEAKCN